MPVRDRFQTFAPPRLLRLRLDERALLDARHDVPDGPSGYPGFPD